MTNHLSCPSGTPPTGDRRRRTVLGVLAFAPFASAGAAFVLFLALGLASLDSTAPGPMFGPAIAIVVALALASGVTTFVAFFALLIDAFGPHVPAQERTAWIVVLVIGNVIAYPVYWYVVWWRRPRLSAGR